MDTTSATSYTATYTTSTTCADSFGYTCTAGPRGFIPASTATALTGDTGSVRVTLESAAKAIGAAMAHSTRSRICLARRPRASC